MARSTKMEKLVTFLSYNVEVALSSVIILRSENVLIILSRLFLKPSREGWAVTAAAAARVLPRLCVCV